MIGVVGGVSSASYDDIRSRDAIFNRPQRQIFPVESQQGVQIRMRLILEPLEYAHGGILRVVVYVFHNLLREPASEQPRCLLCPCSAYA
jgi:hypothetical protein